jgi:hypothetical protein
MPQKQLHKIPPKEYKRGSSLKGVWISYVNNVNASSSPKNNLETNAANTDEIKIAGILPELADRDCCWSSIFPILLIPSMPVPDWGNSTCMDNVGNDACTTSRAKNTPDKGALNPLDTPAAAPHARSNLLRVILSTISSTVILFVLDEAIDADVDEGNLQSQMQRTKSPIHTSIIY